MRVGARGAVRAGVSGERLSARVHAYPTEAHMTDTQFVCNVLRQHTQGRGQKLLGWGLGH